MGEIIEQIGLLIRDYRKRSGLSQQALAELAGVGKTVVFDIEKGKLSVQLDSVLKVLVVLNIQIKVEGPL